MINWDTSNFANGGIVSYPILPAEKGLIVEGHALVGEIVNGTMYAKRSTGATTDTFLGIAFGPRREINAPRPANQAFTVSASALTFNAGRAAIAVGPSADPKVYKRDENTGVITQLTLNAGAPAAGQFQVVSLSPLTVLFNVADAGVVYVEYNYAPTLDDVTFVSGFRPQAYNAQLEDSLNMVAVINQGIIETDQFDNAALWGGAGTLRALANGVLSWGATGLDLSANRVLLRQAPGAGSSWLRIGINS